MTWDDSRLPEGVLEVVKEFQDSDGFIFYEGTSSTGRAFRFFLQDFKLFLQVWPNSWWMVGLEKPRTNEFLISCKCEQK